MIVAREDVQKKGVIDRQAEKIQKLEDRIVMSSTRATNYAFTAFLDKVVTNPVPGQRIPFNKVITNEGQAYSINSGIFNCPQDGLYQFIFNIENDSPGHIVTQLVVDGFPLLSAVNGQYQNAGNSAIVKLTTGNQVWVEVSGGNATILNSNLYRYSTFTGVSLP